MFLEKTQPASGLEFPRTARIGVAALFAVLLISYDALAVPVQFSANGDFLPPSAPLDFTGQAINTDIALGGFVIAQVGTIMLDDNNAGSGVAALYYDQFNVNGNVYVVGDLSIPIGPNQSISWATFPHNFVGGASSTETVDVGLTLGTAVPAVLRVTFQSFVSQPTDQDTVVIANVFVRLELLAGTDDTDGDGVFDIDELTIYGTDPNDADSDDDFLNDGFQELFSDNQTDPLDSDSDNDGLLDGVEDLNKTGTVDDASESDPVDADTDDDGLSDGDEAQIVGTDRRNPDSDGDGLSDGLELGVDAPIPGGVSDGSAETQVSYLGSDASLFVPDLDPTTMTDPNSDDSDGDGLTDGEEDLNHNGRVDEGETDPLVPDVPPPPPDVTCLEAASEVILLARDYQKASREVKRECGQQSRIDCASVLQAQVDAFVALESQQILEEQACQP